MTEPPPNRSTPGPPPGRAEIEAVLRATVGPAVAVEEVNVRSLRPGRRALVEARVATPRGTERFGLKFRHRRAAAVFADWRRVAAVQRGFRVPEPVGLAAEQGCIVYRWVDGPPLLDELRRDGERWVEAAGEALVALHAAPVALARRFGPRQELETLARWIEEAAAAGHPRAGDLRTGRRTLARALPARARSLTPGHRDFYPFQLLATEPPTLLDMDELAQCELALDAGNFAAHLIVDALPELVAPFLAVAAPSREARKRELLYRRAALLRLSAVYWARGLRKHALSVPIE